MAVNSPELARSGGTSTGSQGEGACATEIRPADIHKLQPQNVWIRCPREESAYSLSTRFDVPLQGRALRFVDLLEVQRQAGILQAHRQLAVPEDEVFTLDMIALKLVAPVWDAEVVREDGRIRTQIVASAPRGRSRALAQHFALESAAGLVAVGQSRASLIPRKVYDRVRGQDRNSGAQGDPVSRVRLDYEHRLQVDDHDPLLSDHPSDHVTAMQIIADVERAAADVWSEGRIRSLKMVFREYLEVDPAPTLRLRVSSTSRLMAEVVQFGRVGAKATGRLTMRGRT